MLLSKYNNLNLFIKRHYRSLIPFLTLKKIINILAAFTEKLLNRTSCVSRPFVFRIDPCTVCNLRCTRCPTPNLPAPEKPKMEVAEFKRTVDKINKFALRISLYNNGEPLLNKGIFEMCKYASENRISTLISTNFTLFKREDVETLFKSGLAVLEPCLDGFTQENYIKYRVGGDVETVKKGIRNVMQYKRENKPKWPFVDVQVVLFEHVKDELPLIKQFLEECKVDQITYRLDFHNTVYNQYQTPSNDVCFWLYFAMLISTDGNVYPCCVRREIPYGNIFEQNLDEIWNNKYYRFSRSLFAKGQDIPYNEEMLRIPCFRCDHFKTKRKMLNS
ncbi:MAG: SPASM domain-containing protein [Proteobacteria bacterium]|nr:SPASM domain-containing protein [Pseudomonadota bacterium]